VRSIKATHPDFRYPPLAAPEELSNGRRIKWVSGRPGEAPAYAGTDFIITRDGRIAGRLSLLRQATLSWTFPCPTSPEVHGATHAETWLDNWRAPPTRAGRREESASRRLL